MFVTEENGGLESTLRGVSQVNMEMGIFQDTKLNNGVYTCNSDGSSVVATDAPSLHCGGVAIFYRPSLRFAAKAVHQFGPNVVRF